MAARHSPRNIDPRALRVGIEAYRKVFTGEPGTHVLLDLRSYCRATADETSFEAMADEERTDPAVYRDHVALVRLYRYIASRLEITDDQIDAYRREFEARLRPEET